MVFEFVWWLKRDCFFNLIKKSIQSNVFTSGADLACVSRQAAEVVSFSENTAALADFKHGPLCTYSGHDFSDSSSDTAFPQVSLTGTNVAHGVTEEHTPAPPW